MELAIHEVKLQAKKLLKHIKTNDQLTPKVQRILRKQGVSALADIKLKHCLTAVSQHFGFSNWHHCQAILSGSHTESIIDYGTLFYSDSCGSFINQWFSTYSEAKLVFLKQRDTSYLIPYKTQFVVVKREFIDNLFNSTDIFAQFKKVEHDLHTSYNSNEWDYLAFQVLKKNPILKS